MILWAGRQNIAGFTFLSFRRVEQLATRQHTVSTQTFAEDEVLVLPGGVDPNDLYAVRRLKPHAGGATLDDYIADFRLDFREWSGTRLVSSLLPHQRGNRLKRR